MWPSREVGRSLLPAPSPQPILGFCAHTSLISDLFYPHDVFLGAGDWAFLLCPALFCPTGSLCWAHPGEPASESPAQQGPGETPVVLVLTSASVWALTFAGPSRVTQQRSGGCCLSTTWPVYITGALLFPLLPWIPQQSQAAREQRAEGMH